MAAELDRFGPPLRLFADARATRGVAPVAQEDWKRWFSQRRGLQLAAGRCRFEYRRPRPRLVAVTIAGHDDGVLGAAPLDELMPDLRGRPGRLVLFVDARETLGVATHVRDLWSAWFQAHRDKLETVHVLPGSRLVHLNIGLSRQLSRTGDLIRLHTDAAEFDRALAEATGQARA